MMKTILLGIDLFVLIPTLSFAGYLAFLTFVALVIKPKALPGKPDFLRRFAILVPAHNEEDVLDETLKHLQAIEYPHTHVDIFLIADNCTDSTASIGRANKVIVFERNDPVDRGKGQALRWCLDRLLAEQREYDAFVFIDADTHARPNFLMVMNNHLADGAQCIQCSDLVRAEPGAWSPEVTRLAFILHNYVRPLGKMAFGFSASLNGSGMCFSRKLISSMPWTSYSRVEDLEHALELALRGIAVRFAPETTVLTAMPVSPKDAESQRRRWELARFDIVRKYAGRLFVAALQQRSLMLLDMLFELITPAFVNLMLFTAAMLAVHGVAVMVGAGWPAMPGWLYAIALVLELFHVIGGLIAAHAGRDEYRVLANIPRYTLWKLAVYVKSVVHGDDKSWVRTQRSRRYAA